LLKTGAWSRLRGDQETIAAGAALGVQLRVGDVVCLTGEVGSGKTTLTKGIARGLGLRANMNDVVSPTFVLIKEYPCRIRLFHADLYRLEQFGPVERGLLDECRDAGVTVIEWGEKAGTWIPQDAWRVDMRHRGAAEREIILTRNKT